MNLIEFMEASVRMATFIVASGKKIPVSTTTAASAGGGGVKAGGSSGDAKTRARIEIGESDNEDEGGEEAGVEGGGDMSSDDDSDDGTAMSSSNVTPETVARSLAALIKRFKAITTAALKRKK